MIYEEVECTCGQKIICANPVNGCLCGNLYDIDGNSIDSENYKNLLNHTLNGMKEARKGLRRAFLNIPMSHPLYAELGKMEMRVYEIIQEIEEQL